MTVLTSLFSAKEILLFNQEAQSETSLFEPFALADLLTTQVEQQGPMLHFWETEPTVVLGMKDTRVPVLAAGLKVFKAHNYQYLARNSGGLAVVSDQGILNFSLIIHNDPAHPLTISDGYKVMLTLITKAFADFPVTITAKEISDSYCPGEFDLSINGQKFAGIAQRRIRNGIAVMIYLSVTGPQKERGELIKEFYQASLGENFGQNGYPPVRPSSMANLADLVDTSLTVSDVKKRLGKVFIEEFGATITETTLIDYLKKNDLTHDYQKNLAKMARRNEDLYQIGVEK